MKKWLGASFVIGLLLFAASIAIGEIEKTAVDKSKSQKNLYSQVELFADAVSVLRNEYVDEIDSKKLIYGAMKGMLGSLDDYSQFMEPDEYDEIKIETKGEFGGVGIEISLKDGILTVITPMVGTPAEAAGVKAGDKIVKINGKVTKNITLNKAVGEMRGNPGSTVVLTVWRDGITNILDIPIKRAIIKIHSIKKAAILEDKTGYIKLIEFQENTPRDLDEAIKKLRGEGMDALILDLRNNPGGLLDGAVDVAERFLSKDKVIVSIKARAQNQSNVFKSSGKAAQIDFPLIVLVNEGSASASEIVAGAIKDNKRGIVVGTKTFGKASVQTVIPLKDGSALRFTTAYYFTPSGKLIKEEGIAPDVVIGRSSGADKKKGEEVDIFEETAVGKSVKTGNEVPSTKAEKSKDAELEADNQLYTALNLMKAIKIYKSDKS